jgi:hypothetical protein
MNVLSLADFRSATEEELLLRQHNEHQHNSSVRLHLRAEDIERMVMEFTSSHGGITIGPPTYAAPSPQYCIKPVNVQEASPHFGRQMP